MSPPLQVEFTKAATRQIEEASDWWRAHRPAALGSFASELERVLQLISARPEIGARAFSIALRSARPDTATKPHDRYAPGLHHFAFHANSRSDVNAFAEFLQEIGADILDAPAEYDYTLGYYAVFFADPDGLKLEVVFEPALRGRAG